jgi:hypothetical protein
MGDILVGVDAKNPEVVCHFLEQGNVGQKHVPSDTSLRVPGFENIVIVFYRQEDTIDISILHFSSNVLQIVRIPEGLIKVEDEADIVGLAVANGCPLQGLSPSNSLAFTTFT